MRVGINCLDVNPSFVGGVTTYVLGLLEGFASAGNGCRFRIFVTEGNQHLYEQFRNRDNFEIAVIGNKLFSLRNSICRAASLTSSSGLYKFTSYLAFEKVRELMDAESDVLYTPTPVLRCFNSRRPTVLSMHDIQHVHHPEFFSWPRCLSRNVTYGLSARHATYIQASSQYIKEDLLSHFPWLSPEQVEVIPSGALIERFATPAAADSLSGVPGLPDRFLFFPAQLWPHKNHLRVLKALKLIEAGHGVKIPLVLTGEKYSAAPQIFKFIEEQSMGYVRHVGKVSFQDMVALYQKAAFMITATLHESSSLPILEAAAAGTPIIASRIPPIEELGRVLQLNLFDPLDVDGLARLVLALWNDEKTASAQAAHNREHIGLYSWENTARKYVRLFERIVNS
ncbi:MAG TPA: glycosyltransferase family 1 protein [Terriglobia bacterium]|nr:glycosyltransferase family 1 protein [Candidatus Acidoferrum sp.]HMD85308.1 glycosyltransferase family 1 protein [Terriglobia bacterium]